MTPAETSEHQQESESTVKRNNWGGPLMFLGGLGMGAGLLIQEIGLTVLSVPVLFVGAYFHIYNTYTPRFQFQEELRTRQRELELLQEEIFKRAEEGLDSSIQPPSLPEDDDPEDITEEFKR